MKILNLAPDAHNLAGYPMVEYGYLYEAMSGKMVPGFSIKTKGGNISVTEAQAQYLLEVLAGTFTTKEIDLVNYLQEGGQYLGDLQEKD